MPCTVFGVDVSLVVWVLTVLGLCALIAVDFLFGGRRPHEVSMREAAAWTAVWVALAGVFCAGLLAFGGARPAEQFLAGYVTEKALSVDNLFVFVIIMSRFAVPRIHQQRVLLVGVLIALVLRAVFIAAGAALIAGFSWIFFLFGGFLVWTAWKVLLEARDRHRRAPERDPGRPDAYRENRLLAAVRRRVPATERYHGSRLFVVRDGRRLMTPMLLVMLAIGTTDVLFALDSIPAIFGLTQDPYVVFTANAFALMGLRQLYFLLGGLLRRLVHLSYGLAVVLGFIGVKLVLHAAHEAGAHVPEISTPLSLAVITGVLAVTVATSLVASRRTPPPAGRDGSPAGERQAAR